MKSNRRLKWLLACMVVIAALLIRDRFFHSPTPQHASRTAALPEASRSSRQAQPLTNDILALSDRSAYANAEGDAFPPASRPMPVQRVDPVAPPPPPPPKAPALPFSFIGKEMEAGAWRVFLAQQDSVLVVTDGLVFLDQYKVVKIRPPVMELLYMPLNEVQTIGIGAPHND